MTVNPWNIISPINNLRDEAAAAGDASMMDACDRALNGDESALVEVLEALGDALAANPNTPIHTERTADGFAVRDTRGGVWHPREDVAETVGNCRAALLAVCHYAPTLGVWHD